MAEVFKMETLYRKIQALGLKREFIREILPEWWDDNIAESQAGFMQSALLLSRSLSLDFNALISNESARFSIPTPNFRAKEDIEASELNIAVALSAVAANAVLRGFERELKIDNLTASEVRRVLLSRGHQWVDFRALTEFCWEIGIPVLHLELDGYKKMQGLAMAINQRPVIVLTGRYHYGHLVYDLAHELGHILAGHTKQDIMVDEKISSKTALEQKEIEANQLAIEILKGDSEIEHFEYFSAEELADNSIALGKEKNIDPGYLVSEYIKSSRNSEVMESSLEKVRSKLNITVNEPEICREAMLERLRFNEMGDLEHPMRVISTTLHKAV